MFFTPKLQLWFLLLLFIDTYGAAHTCQPFQCGDLNITYPLSLYDSQAMTSYCGYPGLLVSCESGTTYLRFQSNTYTILSIDYGNQTITSVAASDVLDLSNACPKVQNFSFFPDYGINYTSSDQNLTFFYGCPKFGRNYSTIACISDTVNRSSYVIPTNDIEPYLYSTWAKTCDQVVVVPVQTQYLNQHRSNLSVAFDIVLKSGFQLGWNRTDECRNCEDKQKGQCWYKVMADSISLSDTFCLGGIRGMFSFFLLFCCCSFLSLHCETNFHDCLTLVRFCLRVLK